MGGWSPGATGYTGLYRFQVQLPWKCFPVKTSLIVEDGGQCHLRGGWQAPNKVDVAPQTGPERGALSEH